MKKVFISHATKDEKLVKSFVDDILVGALAIKISEIFCTSLDGTKIESGDDWRDSILKNLKSAKVTFLIITPNYKESEICLNEMGAAWVTSSTVLPVIVEPINYSTVGVIQEPKQVEKLLYSKSLDRIKDKIQAVLSIPSKEIKSDRWTSKKTEFLRKAKKYLAKNPFDIPVSRETLGEIIQEKEELEVTLDAVYEEKAQLEELCNDLKKLKDQKQVKKTIKKHAKTDNFETFKKLCEAASSQLSNFDSIIVGIIYKSFTQKEVSISINGWDQQISNAISRDYIDEDLYVDWDTTKEMHNLYNALKKLEEFIYKVDEDESFVDSYNEEYECPLKMSNKTFWEECLDTTVFLD